MKIIRAPYQRYAAAAAALAILAACSSAPLAPAATAARPPLLRESAARAALRHIDPARSVITIIVRRSGRLASLGHDHVLAAHDIEGDIAPAEGRATLRFRLDALSIDEAQLRAQAGLQAQPDDAAAGTRNNMLKAVDALRYPWVAVTVQALDRDIAQADITLHGRTRRYAVPVASSRQDAATLRARGSLRIRQSDFGIEPFAVLAGALAVADELELSFDLQAD